MEGRRSFPSGHSSTAFAGMVCLSLFLAGLTRAWCFSQPSPGRNLLSSRLARLTISLLPIAWATWVAVSRLEDYVGAVILHDTSVLTFETCSDIIKKTSSSAAYLALQRPQHPISPSGQTRSRSAPQAPREMDQGLELCTGKILQVPHIMNTTTN